MPDLQSEVPQSIKLRLDHLFGPARLLERGEEADVEVAVRRHFAAAIAADRDQRDALARRAVGRRIEMAGGEIMAEADDLVDQERGRARRNPSRRGMLAQPALDLGTAGVERLFEERAHRTATRARIAAFGGHLVAPRSEEHTAELQHLMRIQTAS